jgi:putative redox protein
MGNYTVKVDVEYLGDLHCKATHGPSGHSIMTDAPVDNQGKGEYFSPTDLAGTAMATCVVTIMGIIAKNHGIDIDGLKVSVEKEMKNEPYRMIKRLEVIFDFPRKLSEKEFKLLSAAVDKCPITRSLHPDIVIDRTFNFPD